MPRLRPRTSPPATEVAPREEKTTPQGSKWSPTFLSLQLLLPKQNLPAFLFYAAAPSKETAAGLALANLER